LVPFALRVTSMFRREADDEKIVLRHAASIKPRTPSPGVAS
jgi:hypothetical protein